MTMIIEQIAKYCYDSLDLTYHEKAYVSSEELLVWLHPRNLVAILHLDMDECHKDERTDPQCKNSVKWCHRRAVIADRKYLHCVHLDRR